MSRCIHGKWKYICHICDGRYLCIHSKNKYCCKVCNPKISCEHSNYKFQCKICNSKNLCIHGKFPKKCRKCCKCETKITRSKAKIFSKRSNSKIYGLNICAHNKQKAFCRICKGTQICPHDKQKAFCIQCKGTQICKHNKQKQACKKCVKDPKQKQKQKQKQNSTPDVETSELCDYEKLRQQNILRNKSILESLNLIKDFSIDLCDHKNNRSTCVMCNLCEKLFT